MKNTIFTSKKKTTTFIGVVSKHGKDTYAKIKWPIGSIVRVTESEKKQGFISRSAGYGIQVSLYLENVLFHTKEVVTVVETTETETIL